MMSRLLLATLPSLRLILLLLNLPILVSSSVQDDIRTPKPLEDDGPQLTVSLNYGTFRGAYSKQYNISYWQKIPFAAPPVGQNRFRGPQPPLNLTAINNTIYNSSQPFDMCPQRSTAGTEDCLYLSLYSRPWKPSQPLRPVVLVFYGGGFIRGSASFSSLPPPGYPVLNVSISTDLLFIYPNYRTNAFGFLAGSQIVADSLSDTNVGLLDQRAAIRWANSYASFFGGDPKNVSIWGQSAGGGSVLAQVIGNQSFDGDRGKGGFQKALASSPYWPRTYSSTSPEAQEVYDILVNRTGCGKENDTLSLECLKSAPLQDIRKASEYIASLHTYTTSSYTWAPVIDGGFLPRSLTDATASGRINSVFNFATYNTHEGENFLPAEGISTPAKFDNWLGGFLPGLTGRDLEDIKVMYPAKGMTETLASYESPQVRAGLIYRDLVLACPGYWMASVDEGGWLAEYTISPAKHASDTYWWNQVNSAQQTEPLIYKGYTGAIASFFTTGTPNARKLTPFETVAVPGLGGNEEFVIDSNGFTTAKLSQLRVRCDLWRRLAPRIPV